MRWDWEWQRDRFGLFWETDSLLNSHLIKVLCTNCSHPYVTPNLHGFLSSVKHRKEGILKNVGFQTRLDPTDFHSKVFSCNSLNLLLKVYRFSQGHSQTVCFKCQTKRAEYHGFLNDILRQYSRLPGCLRKLMNVGPCRAQERTEACCTTPSKQENKVRIRIKTAQFSSLHEINNNLV